MFLSVHEGPALGLVFDSVVPGESAGQVLRPRPWPKNLPSALAWHYRDTGQGAAGHGSC